jgi:hypothetical protein
MDYSRDRGAPPFDLNSDHSLVDSGARISCLGQSRSASVPRFAGSLASNARIGNGARQRILWNLTFLNFCGFESICDVYNPAREPYSCASQREIFPALRF